MQLPRKIAILVALSWGALIGAQGGEGAGSAPRPPAGLLSDAGFSAPGSTAIEPGPALLAFSPQYPLWSDGTAKRRWLQLPAGTFIDAADPDAWQFPPGTKLWKEFSLGGPVETRLIERLADGTWRYATYVWNEEGTDAVLAPRDGISRIAAGTAGSPYTIPSEYDCRACHEGASVPVLGFSALQLSNDRDPGAPHAETPPEPILGLRELVALGVVRNLPGAHLEQAPRIAARSPTERAALGYLHGNCGHCHGDPNATAAAVPVTTRFAQDVDDPQSAREVLRSLIGTPSRFRPEGLGASPRVVVPGHADASVLAVRMHSRDPRVQMPPLGTAIPDASALALIERWINEDLPSEESMP